MSIDRRTDKGDAVRVYNEILHACSLSPVRLSNSCLTARTVTCQTSLSMGFPRQEYWSGLPCPPRRNLPDLAIKYVSFTSPALTGRFFTISATWEAPYSHCYMYITETMCLELKGQKGRKGRKQKLNQDWVFPFPLILYFAWVGHAWLSFTRMGSGLPLYKFFMADVISHHRF